MYVVHWLDAQCSKNSKIVKYNWVLHNYFKTSNKINKGFFCDFLFQNTKFVYQVPEDLKLMATSKFRFFPNFRAFFSER